MSFAERAQLLLLAALGAIASCGGSSPPLSKDSGAAPDSHEATATDGSSTTPDGAASASDGGISGDAAAGDERADGDAPERASSDAGSDGDATAEHATGDASSNDHPDGGDAAPSVEAPVDAPGDGGADVDPNVTLYGLTVGDSCFDVLTVEGTPNDGCLLGVANYVGSAMPVNYFMSQALVSVGTMGALGTGPVAYNKGTLTKDRDVVNAEMATCSWHQSDTSLLTMTATNAFTLSTTEVRSRYAAAPACLAASIPVGGTCASSWTWTLKRSFTKTPPCP